MFFILSKLFFFLTKPLNWILIGISYASITKNEWQRKKAISRTLILFLFFTNPFIFNIISYYWESPMISMNTLEQYDIAIVLGGFTRTGLHRVDDRYTASAANPRITTAIELYKLGKVKKILISSGDGAVFRIIPEPEADEVKAYLLRIGIPEQDIIIENASKNTRENAIFTKRILNERYPKAQCLLITSAYHMRRSIACFNKVNLTCTAFPADNKSERITNEPRTWLSPDPEYLLFWQLLIKEWIGFSVYKIVGYA
ncbi:MAG: YdcF family protein [Saprospiraceae bacterium]